MEITKKIVQRQLNNLKSKGGGFEVSNSHDEIPPKPGMILVYCRYIVRNGKRIYPKKAQFFRFWVEPKAA